MEIPDDWGYFDPETLDHDPARNVEVTRIAREAVKKLATARGRDAVLGILREFHRDWQGSFRDAHDLERETVELFVGDIIRARPDEFADEEDRYVWELLEAHYLDVARPTGPAEIGRDMAARLSVAAKRGEAVEKAVIDALARRVAAADAKGKRLSVAGLGDFSVARRPESTARNPRSGETIIVPGAIAARLRLAPELKRFVIEAEPLALDANKRVAAAFDRAPFGDLSQRACLDAFVLAIAEALRRAPGVVHLPDLAWFAARPRQSATNEETRETVTVPPNVDVIVTPVFTTLLARAGVRP
jgi:DNA-binding protein HU-beta